MSSLEEFSDSLANEVITEMADNFFGRRAEVEARINLFHAYVKRFRAMERMVISSAGFLNHLMVEPSGARDFFRTIGVDDADSLLENTAPGDIPLERLPSALTDKGRFTKLVLWSYDDLKTSCHEYIYGSKHETPRQAKGDDIELGYNLLKAMHRVVNEEVSAVNANISPTALLQSVRQFDAVAGMKARTMDAGAGPGGLDGKLAFRRIDFDALGLKPYPELPNGNGVRTNIKSFCKSYYAANRRAIKIMLSDLKARIRKAPIAGKRLRST